LAKKITKEQKMDDYQDELLAIGLDDADDEEVFDDAEEL